MNPSAPQPQRPQILYRTADGRLVAPVASPAAQVAVLPTNHGHPNQAAQVIAEAMPPPVRQQQQVPPTVQQQQFLPSQGTQASGASARPLRQAPLTAWKRDLATTGLATCVHPQCCVSFLSLSGMVAHHKTCIGVAPPGTYVACDLCGTRFKQYKSMTTHREKAHYRVVQNTDTKTFTMQLRPETLHVRTAILLICKFVRMTINNHFRLLPFLLKLKRSNGGGNRRTRDSRDGPERLAFAMRSRLRSTTAATRAPRSRPGRRTSPWRACATCQRTW